MTRKRYIPEDNQVLIYEEFSVDDVSAAVEAQLDARIPLTFDGNRVMYDTDDIPEGVSENDVQQAIRDNHPHR